MGNSLLIKGGRVVDPSLGIDGSFDILINNNKIVRIEQNINEKDSDQVINAFNKIVTPGFVEMHAHLREPGYTDRDTMYAATSSAAAGGYTSVTSMPDTDPIIDTPDKIKLVKSLAEKKSVVNLFPYSAATKGRNGEELVDMEAMVEAGAVAFSDDGNAFSSSVLMREALEATKKVNRVLDVHCEDKEYSAGGIAGEEVAKKMGLPGISAAAEDMMIARDLIIQEEVDGHLHIAHLGSARSVELVEFFKNRGVNFTCEVIPHQFTYTQEIVAEKGTKAKVKPPFRTHKDVKMLQQGVAKNLIDVVATDHCPYTDEEIDCAINETSLFGLSGFETTFPLILKLVNKNIISLYDAIKLVTINPARILRLDKGSLKIGRDADIAIIDLDKEWTVNTDDFKTKASNSPYNGEILKGKIIMTIVNGEVVYKKGEILK